jgi:hypothetical protein
MSNLRTIATLGLVTSSACASTASWHTTCAEAFNRSDWTALSDCYAEDAESLAFGEGPPIRGREAIIETRARGQKSELEDARRVPELTLMRDKEIVSVVLFSSTAKKVSYPIMQDVRLDDRGRATSEIIASDTPLLLAQLGKNPSPARAPIEGHFSDPVVVLAKGDETETKNAAAHVNVYALFSAHDRSMADHFAEDIVERSPSEAEDIRGKTALMAFNEAFWAGFSDIRVEVSRAWGAGDYTFVEGRLIGTNDGEMPALGLSKTGRKIDVPFLEIVKWQDGKAKLSLPFMNSLVLAMQLGLAG